MANQTRRPNRLLRLLAPPFAVILGAACVGGDSPQPTPEPPGVNRPAISRSGATPTATPLGGPLQPRRDAPPLPTPEPEPARSPVEGLVNLLYTYPFIWPVEGAISSFMSPLHPNGIDLAFADGELPAIRAAAGGTVTSAGGDDDEALGVSVVIDHGNGVTTTYGHLSELLVAEGDVVEIGDALGIGGSTGISTGAHLHFEVRKDGDTVDPIHVLPVGRADTADFAIDCATTPFTLPSGSQALIDVEGLLAAGEQVVSADVVSLSGGPELRRSILSTEEVQISSTIDFEGPNQLDSYDLDITIDNGTANRVLNCAFVVQRSEVPTTFYVRAASPVSDEEAGDSSEDEDAVGLAEEAPEPTATPSTWPQTPSYEVPSGASSAPHTPLYSIPGAGVPALQSPNYGPPTPAPSPTASPEPTEAPAE